MKTKAWKKYVTFEILSKKCQSIRPQIFGYFVTNNIKRIPKMCTCGIYEKLKRSAKAY